MSQSRGPIQPDKIIKAGMVFIVLAVFLVAIAWIGLGALRSGVSGATVTLISAGPAQATPGAGATGPALDATQVGSFLRLPTQTQPAPPAPSAQPGLLPTAAVVTPALVTVDVERLLAEMSLEEKVGQLIMTGVSGQIMGAQAMQLIREYQIGSVVYFGENTHDPQQVSAYSQALQEAAAGSGRGIPLLIAVDHEGGRVFRFRQGMTHFPNPMALGAAHSEDLSFRAAAASAQELRAAGINLALAPVLDVNDEALNPVIGMRAFAGFSDLAAMMGGAYIRGLQENGVVAAAKHFPGHGSTTVDSHETLPVVHKSLDELEQQELIPFRAAVENEVGVVMVGHIALPLIDSSGAPASLSPIILQTLLRERLGYNGVVMTDAMSMGAIAGSYSLAEAAVGAVNAGCDIVAYTDAEAAVIARNVVLQAVKSGRVSGERVDEAARRVLLLKQQAGLFSAQTVDPAVDQAAHAALARELARSAISLVGAATQPLVSADRLVLVTPDTLPVGSREGDGLSLLGELLTGRGIQVDEWVYPVDDAAGIAAIQAQALAAAQRYPQVVVVSWDARLNEEKGNPAQVDLIDAFEASGRPALLVAAGSPFDLALVPENGAGVAIYGGLQIQIEALADALLAGSAPPGALPVPIAR